MRFGGQQVRHGETVRSEENLKKHVLKGVFLFYSFISDTLCLATEGRLAGRGEPDRLGLAKDMGN